MCRPLDSSLYSQTRPSALKLSKRTRKARAPRARIAARQTRSPFCVHAHVPRMSAGTERVGPS